MKTVYIKTIGTVERTIIENLTKSLQLLLPVQLKFIEDRGYPLFAFEPKRNQYYAKKIIEKLARQIPADCEKLIGLTDVDLCTPVLTFVYGEAQLGGSIAVVSLNRLRQEFYYLPRNDTLLIERITKECIHELGHCYGLYHCSDSRCVMCFSSSVLSIDNKQKEFCVSCGEFFEETMRKENNAPQ
jgi:archaemetzincin